MENATSPARWYVSLNARLQSLMQTLGIPDDMGQQIREFMFAIAKEQYMAGNKSGIRWARQGGSNYQPATS